MAPLADVTFRWEFEFGFVTVHRSAQLGSI
jgi:hypothetical protein